MIRATRVELDKKNYFINLPNLRTKLISKTIFSNCARFFLLVFLCHNSSLRNDCNTHAILARVRCKLEHEWSEATQMHQAKKLKQTRIYGNNQPIRC
jgi:hypothetical protein